MVQHVEQSALDETVLRRFVIAFLSAAAVLTIFDLFSLRLPWRRGEVNNADKWSLIITVSNLGLLCLHIPSSFSCWHPVFVWTLQAALYLFSRGINILFFVYRAKSVQGPNPVLSEKWFTKYIPTVVGTYYGIAFLFAIYDIPTNPNIVCVSNQFSYRSAAVPSLWLWIFVAMELSITAAITFLFVVPLWRLYRGNRAGANANISIQQQRSMTVLKDSLKYAVVLTAINLLSSSNVVLGSILYRDDHYNVWHCFRGFDPVINIATTIMLFKRNRALLWRVFCRIRSTIGQMCCFAFIMETEIRILDAKQAQRNLIALQVITAQIANIKGEPDLKVAQDSITEFNDAPFDIEFKDCS